MSLVENLYEHDFYAWALEQADVLRRRQAGANALDYENLAEEVEGLGMAELRACESLLRQIVKHFMKIASADESQLRDVPHWRQEIVEFRLQIEAALTPSLRVRFDERAPEVIDRQIGSWKQVDRAAAAEWRLAPPSLAECLEEESFPESGAGVLRPVAAD